MTRNGFTLVEMLIVIAIASVLLCIATLSFNSMTKSSSADSQMKVMASDLMGARSQALYEKRGRSVTISTTRFSAYSSTVLGNPVLDKTLSAPVTPNTLQVDFDQWGAATLNGDPSITDVAVCAGGSDAGIDSIIISRSRIQMGKLKGVGCTSANIEVK